MNNQLISVIVPIYMVERYLEKCINSIINQTYKNLEIILVNDGSKDNCLEICKKYEKKDSRIKILDKQNGGLSDARNKGIDIAKGDYIAFIDSDDYIEKDMYEKLIKIINDNDADIAICGYKKVDEDGKEILYKKQNEKTKDIKVFNNKQEAMYALLEDREITNHAWNKLYKKELFREIRYPFGKKFEDIGTTYYLFDISNKIVYISDKLYNYVQREGSILANETIELLANRIEIENERIKYLIEKGYDKEKILCANIKVILNEHIDYAKKKQKTIYYSETLKSEWKKLKNIKLSEVKRLLKTKNYIIKFLLVKYFRQFTYYLFCNNKKEMLKNLCKKILIRIKYKKKEIKSILQCNRGKGLKTNTKKAYIFLAADYANLGDVAITLAQKKYIEKIFNNYEIIEVPLDMTYKKIIQIKNTITEDDLITIIGGGNMTNRYEYIEELRRIVIKIFKNNKIISFPQTIDFTDDIAGQESLRRSQKLYSKNKNLHIFAREPKSYKQMKYAFQKNNVYMCPDIVFTLDKEKNNKRNGIGVCLRDDKEKLLNKEQQDNIINQLDNKDKMIFFDTHIGDEKFEYEKRYDYLEELLEKISKLELVITDRLHGMIFCYITSTPCIAFDNDNHKISETYMKWLNGCNFIKLVDKNEINCINIEQIKQNICNVEKIRLNLEEKFQDLNQVLLDKSKNKGV